MLCGIRRGSSKHNVRMCKITSSDLATFNYKINRIFESEDKVVLVLLSGQ